MNTTEAPNFDGLMSMEQSFLKVPYEQHRKSFRNAQKLVEKEMSYLSKEIKDIGKKTMDKKKSAEEAMASLKALKKRSEKWKAKVSANLQESQDYVARTKYRAQHLNEMNDENVKTASQDAFRRWNRIKTDRLMVDYMLREGYFSTAKLLSKEANVEELVELKLFDEWRVIESALMRKSCTECLQWCNENKSNLRKLKSPLEFNLRLQEFVELVRARDITKAILYAKKHFPNWASPKAEEDKNDVDPDYLKRIQRAMALLAFRPSTKCEPYKSMYSSERWNDLGKQFRNVNYELHNLTANSMLEIQLQMGLSVLKTPMCYNEADKNINCPVCTEPMNTLAKDLPYSHHIHSTLVCRISGKIMDHDNAPMALPNGNVYSHDAMKDMADKNHGMVTDPKTGKTFRFAELKKVFIM